MKKGAATTIRTVDMHPYPTRGAAFGRTYKGWLGVFREVAEHDTNVLGPLRALRVPPVWCPLVYYLGADPVPAEQSRFDEDAWIPNGDYFIAEKQGLLRRYVEMTCTLRPELTEALYLSDCVWSTSNRRDQENAYYLITNYNSFHTPVFFDVWKRLDGYERPKDKRNAVIVPYEVRMPGENQYGSLQQKILAMLPDDSWHIIIASGLFGLVPEELWNIIPAHDIGLTNPWRVQEETKEYFRKHDYERIVVYSDHVQAVMNGLILAGFGRDPKEMIDMLHGDNIEDLYDSGRLDALKTLLLVGRT